MRISLMVLLEYLQMVAMCKGKFLKDIHHFHSLKKQLVLARRSIAQSESSSIVILKSYPMRMLAVCPLHQFLHNQIKESRRNILTAHGDEEEVKEIAPSSVGEYTYDGKCSFETSWNGNYEADKDSLSGIQEEMQFGISSIPS
ncbi:Hypothetical predicted protein [Olea europaea subsp. europaea]|uniref:Uncharacterized protein n=1 Tax=Olea europaea subsp. europaea TaxID=158383 RepID=A0A8S0SU41_OLEEU|nr:Hypothetical predicted protein [Olea europaea subsp. europaea]